MSSDPGLFDALRRVAGSALTMLHSRVELAGLELGETGRRLFATLLVALFATLLLLVAVLLATGWLVMLMWPTWGAAGLGLFALLYLVLGLALLWWVQRRIEAEPPLLESTMNELRHDAALLRRQPSTPPSP